MKKFVDGGPALSGGMLGGGGGFNAPAMPGATASPPTTGYGDGGGWDSLIPMPRIDPPFAPPVASPQVTQFQPTFSPAQQGIGSLPYQAPNVPAMESSPTDYNQSPQYAPTTSYSAPAANPMTAGLGSYLEGLKYKAPVTPVTPAPTTNTTSPAGYNPATQTYGTSPVTPTTALPVAPRTRLVPQGEDEPDKKVYLQPDGSYSDLNPALIGVNTRQVSQGEDEPDITQYQLPDESWSSLHPALIGVNTRQVSQGEDGSDITQYQSPDGNWSSAENFDYGSQNPEPPVTIYDPSTQRYIQKPVSPPPVSYEESTFDSSGTTPSPTIYNPATQGYSDNPAFTAPVAPVAKDSGSDSGYFYDDEGDRRSVYDEDGNRRYNDDGSNLYGGGDGGDKAGGPIRAYAHGGSTPQGIASLGRGKDTMLVHMTPGEVHGLQQLAMRHGGSLTINPQTGLPEAGILSSLLPLALGFALGPAGLGMSSLAAAATVGGIGALATGSLAKGLSAGFGAYGGAGLGEGLSSMGAEQADKLATPVLNDAAELGRTAGNTASDSALKFAEMNKEAAIEEAIKKAQGVDEYLGDAAYRTSLTANPLDNRLLYNAPRPTDFVANPYSQEGVEYMQSQGMTGDAIAQSARESAANASPMPAYSPATQEALARSPTGNAFEGFKQLGTKEGLKTLGGKLGLSGVASLAAPLLSSAMTPAATALPTNKPSQYYNTSYNPPKYNPATGAYDPASYGPGSYYTDPTQYAAQGGTVGYARGGTPDFYPLTGDKVSMNAAPGGLGGSGEKPQYSRDMYGNDSGAGINDNKAGRGAYSDDMGRGIHTNTPSGIKGLFAKTSATMLARYKTAKNPVMQAEALAELRKRASAVDDYGAEETTSAAQGGLMGTYAAGGKLLRGPGDGMSDSIPAVIQGANPQRAALADGEFVMPADVVSHLGNGSTEAGSKRLYAMMDRVRKARTGNPKQGRQINPNRFMPA